MSATYLFDGVPMAAPHCGVRRAGGDPGRPGIRLNQSRALRWPDSIIRRLREFTGIGGPVTDHRASWVLPDDLSSVPAGRRLIHAQLSEWEFPGETDVVELLVDELVTNALRHARGQPVLTLSIRAGVLRCVVEDETSELPHAESPTGCEESGRGLQMVELLSRRWGVEPTRTGKAVWFEVLSD
ncbi:ATP-binding protein [Nonomuraea sp. K274]|uniref:ATP-binding protein n=1 Tax=Nonomuraea cypriaca TaxID=1187855 RepID=A0A931A6P1_9ACTN|nr:ATP-binding protein [Nonomuraea cypriaca]MBF8184379.1 ATP-binding protein [Nonomuraea cypriaca]